MTDSPVGGRARLILTQFLSHPSALLLGSTISSMVLGIGSAAIQARLLGPIGRGELAIAMVPGTLIALLLSAGLPDFSARKAALAANTRAVSALTLIFSMAIGLVVLAPYWVFSGVQGQTSPDARSLLIVFAITLPSAIYGSCLTSLAIGSGNWRIVAVLRVLPVASSVVALLVIGASGLRPSVLQVGLILISTTYSWPAAYLFIRHLRPTTIPSKALAVEAVSFAARGWPAGAIALLNQRVDLLMMTALASREALGYYAVSTTLAAVLNAVANAIAMPMRNRITQGKVATLPTTAASTMALILVLALAIVACLPLLIRIVLGTQFLPAQPVMVVLLLAQVPLAGVVVLTQALVGFGKPGAPLLGEIVALVATVALILATFTDGGIIAAAVATGVGNVLSLFVLIHRVRQNIARFPLHSFFAVKPRIFVDLIIRNREAAVD